MSSLEDDAKETVKQIFKLMNYYGGPEKLSKELYLELMHEHRTLQQNFMRMLKDVVAEYAKNTTTDARNEAAKEWAMIATEATKHINMPHI